jgi:hypothetical protein
MYIKGASRRSVSFWAGHLQNTKENLRADIIDARGLAAGDLKDMMLEMEQDARFTRCKNFMYIASFNPCPGETLTEKQWERAYEIFEKHRGIPPGQQRIVIEHEKEGRIHRHVVWNRVDLENMRAFPDGKNPYVCSEAKQEIERELELERTPGIRERETGDRAALKSYEMYRGMKTGLDPRAITAEVTQIFRESQNGADFVQGLRQHGYQFVQGRRAFCILDSAGHEHSLARRLENVNTKDLRSFMQGVDLGNLPTVERARVEFRERKIAELEADRDTVRNEIEWLEALAKAAIEKEKIEQRFVEPNPERTKGQGNREKVRAAEAQRERAAPELGKTAGEIRLAYRLTHSGQGFANALEDRGLFLARVTQADADRLNRWERQRLKELKELDEALGAAASSAASRPEQHPDRAGTGGRSKHTAMWFEQTGGIEMLTAEMREKAEASYGRWKHKSRHEFADYVNFVQTQQAKKREAESALGQGQSPEPEKPYEKYKAGELVIVDQWGNVHQMNVRNTGDLRKDREQHLKDIDRAPLLSVSAAESVARKFGHHRQDEKHHEWEERGQVWEQQRAEKHWPTTLPQPQAIKTSPGFHFEDAGREATGGKSQRSMNERMSGPAAEIWSAWHQSDNARAFAAALEQQGISLAVVTKTEADRSHRRAEFARATGDFAPRYREGEIVAVAEPGLAYRDGQIEDPRVYRLSKATTGEERWKIEAFLKPLDRSPLQGIDATKELVKARAEQRILEIQGFRDLLSEVKNHERLRKAQEGIRISPVRAGDLRPSLASSLRVAEKSVSPAFKLLGAAGKLADGFFELIDPVLTPALKREKEIVARTREAEAESTTDMNRYVAERRRQQEERPPDRKERERER